MLLTEIVESGVVPTIFLLANRLGLISASVSAGVSVGLGVGQFGDGDGDVVVGELLLPPGVVDALALPAVGLNLQLNKIILHLN